MSYLQRLLPVFPLSPLFHTIFLPPAPYWRVSRVGKGFIIESEKFSFVSFHNFISRWAAESKTFLTCKQIRIKIRNSNLSPPFPTSLDRDEKCELSVVVFSSVFGEAGKSFGLENSFEAAADAKSIKSLSKLTTEAAAAPNYKIEKSLKNNSQIERTFTSIKNTTQYVILNKLS